MKRVYRRGTRLTQSSLPLGNLTADDLFQLGMLFGLWSPRAPLSDELSYPFFIAFEEDVGDEGAEGRER